MKANRLVLLATGTAVLALSGCTPSGNVAARVGDAVVPNSAVDFLTRMQCDTLDQAAKDPSQQGSVQMVPTSRVRTGMLNTLMDAELNDQLAKSRHLTYDRSTLAGVMNQFEAVVKRVPAKDQDRFRSVVEHVYRGQLEVYTLAEGNLAGQGVSSPSQTQVDQAVASIQADYRKTVDIEVNPQYGADDKGVAGSVDPSLSIPVSSFAKQSQASSPDSAWVAKLPADQRCG